MHSEKLCTHDASTQPHTLSAYAWTFTHKRAPKHKIIPSLLPLNTHRSNPNPERFSPEGQDKHFDLQTIYSSGFIYHRLFNFFTNILMQQRSHALQSSEAVNVSDSCIKTLDCSGDKWSAHNLTKNTRKDRGWWEVVVSEREAER